MPHQLVGEEHLKEICIYCKAKVPVENFRSEWFSEKHYKSLTCSCCGRKLHIAVDFAGSGHDSWNGNGFKQKAGKKKTIEDKITIIDNVGEIVSRSFPKKK